MTRSNLAKMSLSPGGSGLRNWMWSEDTARPSSRAMTDRLLDRAARAPPPNEQEVAFGRTVHLRRTEGLLQSGQLAAAHLVTALVSLRVVTGLSVAVVVE